MEPNTTHRQGSSSTDQIALFEKFIRHGVYLRAWGPRTTKLYRSIFKTFASDTLSKSTLEEWLVTLRERGASAAYCNIGIRCLNACCAWAHEEQLLPTRLKLKQLKHHPKPIQPFSEAEIRLLMANKPRRITYQRTWLLAVLLLDTGLRVDEALRLKQSDINFDDLLLSVRGKGDKPRLVPFSRELRKHLFRYCERLTHDTVFGTRTGNQMTYNNMRRGFKAMFKQLGMAGPHVRFHVCRHTFAVSYIKNNGNLYALSRILGHSSVAVTEIYLRGLGVADMPHHSPLGG